MLQPETGQHMEYAGNVTQESSEQNNPIIICIYGWWRLYGWYVFGFLRKANFSLLQRNKFYLTIMVVVKHWEGTSNSIPIKNVINPIKLN